MVRKKGVVELSFHGGVSTTHPQQQAWGDGPLVRKTCRNNPAVVLALRYPSAKDLFTLPSECCMNLEGYVSYISR